MNAFVLRRCGGFIVHTARLDNPVYAEAVRQYLSIIAGHGVSLLHVIDRAGRGDEFYRAVSDSVYKHGVELAIVPAEISYLSRPEGLPIGIAGVSGMLANVAHVNFSRPVFISDYTREPHMLEGLPGIIAGIWEKEKKLFPHYVICKILRDSGDRVRHNDITGMVKDYLRRSVRSHDYGPSKMTRKGLRFLENSGIIRIDGGFVIVLDSDRLSYYADLVS